MIIIIIVVVALLAGYLLRRQGRWSVLIAIFLYASIHGIYAICDSVMGNAHKTMSLLHQHSRFDINMIGGAFVIGASCLLFRRAFKLRNLSFSLEQIGFLQRMFMLLIIFMMLMVFGGINQTALDPLTLVKEIVFPLMMWGFALFFAFVMSKETHSYKSYIKDIFVSIFCLTLLTIVIGVYEIESGIVWARTGDAQRASGMMFNPNSLGMWLWCVVLGLAYLFHARAISKTSLTLLLALVVACFVLSGSRSGLILSIVTLLSASLLLPKNKTILPASRWEQWFPLVMLLLLLVLVDLLIHLMSSHTDYFIWKILGANISRFVTLPGEMIALVERTLHLNFFSQFLNVSLDTLDSLRGRATVGAYSDNTFFEIYFLGGKLALFTWCLIWSYVISVGVKRIRCAPDVNSVYGVVSVTGCMLSGFFLRSAELFPLWVLLSLVLGVSIRGWLRA